METNNNDIIERERQRIEKKEAIEAQRKQMIENLSEELVFGDYAPLSISPLFSVESTYNTVKHWLELTRNRLNMEKMLCDEVIRGNFKIKIFTNYNSPSLNQNKKVSVMETLNNIIMIDQMSQQSKYIEANKEDLIKEQAEMGGIALDIRTESPEVRRKLEELDAKMARLAGVNQAPQSMNGGQIPVPPGQPPEPSVPSGIQP